MKVLIADDDRLVRAMLRDVLADLGHEVMEAENGEDAVARAERDWPDALIVDFLMPRLSGLDALKRLRSGGRRVPAVLLTAISDASVRAISGDEAPDAILEKPFTKRGVERALARAIRLAPP